MVIETEDWLKEVTTPAEDKDVIGLVDKLVSVPNINLVSVYEKAQSLGLEYLGREEEIPTDLVTAILDLAGRPSGFTGLTVHEAWIGFNRKK